MKKVIALLQINLLIALLAELAMAQMPCKTTHYSTEDGLSDDVITCMFKDREGYMWFGTWNGINRFDGRRFTAFKSEPGDMSQLTSDRIDQITEDNFDHLWIKAYNDQIYRFDKATEQFECLSGILRLKKKIVFNRILSADQHGMLWASTFNDGLICVPDILHHPTKYLNYKKGAGGGLALPGGNNNFFYSDKRANIWIGTPQGLACLSLNKAGVYTAVNLKLPGNPQNNFTAVAECKGKLYFSTGDGKVLVYDVAKHQFLSLQITGSYINAMCAAKNGKSIYIATANGALIMLDAQTLKTECFVNDPAVALHTIFEDGGGNLWLAPDRSGIVRFDMVKRSFKTFTQQNDSHSSNPGNHFTVFEDNKGTVWSILRDGGFGYYNPVSNKLEYFYNQPNAANRRFSNLAVVVYYDPMGVLWLHTDERGIEKVNFQPNEFQQHLIVGNASFKSDNEVRGLLTDKQNRLWVGGKSGHLFRITGGQQEEDLFVNMPAGGLGAVYAIAEAPDGVIWLGTKANGLYRADPVDSGYERYKLTHYQNNPNNPTSISSDEIYSIVADKLGQIWIGSFDQGLNLLRPKINASAFLRFSLSKSGYPPGFLKIRHMAMDAQNRLWVGTTAGLVIGERQGNKGFKFSAYTKQPGNKTSLGKNDIQYVFKDSKNKMWLATSGGGLNLAVEDPVKHTFKFKVYTTRDGLANDYLLSCAEDNSHRLWIATKSSLSCFNPLSEHFRNYNSYDGVPNAAFSEASGQMFTNGQLVFGTIRGYLTFNPGQIKAAPAYANMVFTNLQVNNKDVAINSNSGILTKSINYTPSLRLKYNQDIISIDYALLDFRSDNQSYLYRLKGFDNEWHNNKNILKATYTNLPTGSYVFEVKSVDKERYLNIPAKSLAIDILPPPWATWWAWLIYAVLIIVLFEAVRRTIITVLNLRQKVTIEQKLTELKLNFFTNISHELRTPLTLIINPIDEIAKVNVLSIRDREYVAIVQRNTNRMVRFVNQLLDFRKIQSGKAKLNLSTTEVVAFIWSISQHFNELAKGKQITLNVIAVAGQIFASFDADKMETVLYNLMSNAYKFTPPGKQITISITQVLATQQLHIEVNDEGCGVPADELNHIFELYHMGAPANTGNQQGTGIGLALSKEFVELHGGSISAKNLAGGGLSVGLNLPLGDVAVINPVNVVGPVASAQIPFPDGSDIQFKPAAGIKSTELPLILLVEDNPDMRTFLQTQLSTVYKVITAGNGAEGLDMVKQFQPDLILSDVMMPVMDGIEMLGQLKNDALTSHIPVILLSAKTAVESQVRGLNYGADYYITKPFENEFLLAAVSNILRQRKQIFELILSGKKVINLNPAEIIVTSKDETFLKSVIAIVEEKMLDPDFNIESVAETMNMARATFFKKFKSLTQMAPVEFVRQTRLKRAKQYFDAGNNNVTEVAYTVGFTSGKYFSTCFKAQYRMSPSDYLKLINAPAGS